MDGGAILHKIGSQNKEDDLIADAGFLLSDRLVGMVFNLNHFWFIGLV